MTLQGHGFYDGTLDGMDRIEAVPSTSHRSDAFNGGDRAKIETYVKTVDHSQAVDGMLAFRTQTGGFDLLSIESSEPLHIRFRVKEKGPEKGAEGNPAWGGNVT